MVDIGKVADRKSVDCFGNSACRLAQGIDYSESLLDNCREGSEDGQHCSEVHIQHKGCDDTDDIGFETGWRRNHECVYYYYAKDNWCQFAALAGIEIDGL